MPEYVVLGAGGMLGRALVAQLEAASADFVAFDRDAFDLMAPSRQKLEGARVVLNAAAYTAVDDAETHTDEANALNGDAPGRLAAICDGLGCTLVHYSTDYVFDGQASRPYATDHPIAPCNAYGHSKALGEAAIRAATSQHLILRTSWLFAPWGNNFVRTIAKLAATKDTLSVVNDQHGRPTCAIDLAAGTLALCQAGATGTLHYANSGATTWYGLATEVVRAVGADCEVRPCGSEAYPRPAVRPPYSVFDTSETEALIGPLPAWQPAVARAVA